MSRIPDFAGAKISALETALKERCQHPLELHRVGIYSRLYPSVRELSAYREKDSCLFVQADHKLQSNMTTELGQ